MILQSLNWSLRVTRQEVAEVVAWCLNNNLFLNANKTKEIVNSQKSRKQQMPLNISETEVVMANNFTFLSVHISRDLTWSHNTYLIRKYQQCLYFLRRLKKFGMPSGASQSGLEVAPLRT